MIEGQFSRTALAAGGYRAAHQVADGGSVFLDPFAARVMGADLPAYLEHCADPKLRPLRLFIALRSRIAEDVARRADRHRRSAGGGAWGRPRHVRLPGSAPCQSGRV